MTDDSPQARVDRPGRPENTPRTMPDNSPGESSRASDSRAGDSRAIDALRAATDAAATPAAHVWGARPQPTPDEVSQIARLHEATETAERRARRVLGTPGARRKLQYAIAAESAALRIHGFNSYEEFAAHYEGPPSEEESDETIARIRVLLTELGVDPQDDPVQAASEFLTTHEGDVEPVEERHDHIVEHFDIASVVAGVGSAPEVTPEPVVEPAFEPVVEPAFEPVVEIASEPEPIVSEVVLPAEPPREPVDEMLAFYTPIEAIAAARIEPLVDPSVDAAGDAPIEEAPIELEDEIGLEETPEEIWAQPPTPKEPVVAEEEAVDRWIHAEARAERMHAEVDRAQSELMAMLARSADLEESVVTRDDELDAANAELTSANTELNVANAELERVRLRVGELEDSISRSDTERDELERALAVARDRVAELESAVLQRERAAAQATSDRALSLQAVAELEASVATSAEELELVRATVAEMEAALATNTSRLEQARGELTAARTELGTANADKAQLNTELDNTRRALEALDDHAEKIEAELAAVRREAENPETRRELEEARAELADTRQELAAARTEISGLEAQRAETELAITRDRGELEQLRETLATMRQEAEAVHEELVDARRVLAEVASEVDIAEQARQAITIDTADLLARAEAQATSLLERANRDADAIRQEALRWEEGLREEGRREEYRPAPLGAENASELMDRVERLERKVAKQRRRLDRLSGAPGTGDADREAAEIRAAARRDREQFRAELEGLVRRLAPLEDGDDEDDYL